MITTRPFGLEVRIGIGWLLSYLLIAASLMLWFGMPEVASLPPVVRFVAVLAVPVLLLPGVVAHELAHALVARRRGLPVEVVDLRMVGVPAHGSSGQDPGTEALVAIAGPVVSAILGVAALACGVVLLDSTTEAAALAAWVCLCLAAGNLLLAIVSLYPGAPMDGGRIVHAIARRTSPDAATATRRAGAVGIGAGWLVILAGLAVAVAGETTAGLWLMLMGWFLGRAARLARSQEKLIRLTAGLEVGDALQTDMPVVSPGLTLDTLMTQNQLVSGPEVYPVKQGDALLGIINVRDIRRIPAKQRMELRVSDRMRPLASLRSVRQDQQLWDAVAILEQGRQGALLVVDATDPGHLLGMVTRASVTRVLKKGTRVVPDDNAG